MYRETWQPEPATEARSAHDVTVNSPSIDLYIRRVNVFVISVLLVVLPASAQGHAVDDRPQAELVLSLAGFVEVCERLAFSDVQLREAERLYHEYQESVERLARDIHRRVQDAGAREIEEIQEQYWKERTERGVIVREDDHERIALERDLKSQMRERIAESGLLPKVLDAQRQGNRDTFMLLIELMSQLRELCDDEQLDLFEHAKRGALRSLWKRAGSGGGRGTLDYFGLPDLVQLLNEAKKPGNELALIYDPDQLAALDEDVAATLADLRWTIDETIRRYELEADHLVQQFIRIRIYPPLLHYNTSILYPGTPEWRQFFSRRSRQWSSHYRIVQSGLHKIAEAIAQGLSQDSAADWELRFRQSVAPNLMREFWIEGPLQRWLEQQTHWTLEERHRIQQIVDDQRDAFDQERERAFDLGVVCMSRHGNIIGQDELHRRYRESRQRILSFHEQSLEIILTVLAGPERERLRETINEARIHNTSSFGERYLSP